MGNKEKGRYSKRHKRNKASMRQRLRFTTTKMATVCMKNERNSGNNNPRRKRKGALNVNSNTNAKKQRKSNRLNNTTAPIEEVLIKTEPTNEPIEEVFINQEHITEPVLDIAVKDEPIDPVPEVVIKEECLDDYPVDSQTYKNLQINIKTEEDDEETYATTGQSS